jgi:hypothetical protein
MMTVGEQRHAAVTEHELRRIADALESVAKSLDAFGAMMNRPDSAVTYDELKERGAKA